MATLEDALRFPTYFTNVSEAMGHLRQSGVAKAAGDAAGILVRRDKDNEYVCDLRKHGAIVDSTSFRTLAFVREWIKVSLPKIYGE